MKRLASRHQIIWLGVIVAVAGSIWLFQAVMTHPVDSYNDCAEAGNEIIEGNPPICIDGKHRIRGPLATPAPSQAAQASVPFDILVEGSSGGGYPRRQEVITTQADWQGYWQRVHAGLPSLPPLIPVDFTASEVVALSEGVQTTTGYSYKVTSIMTSATGTQINVTESIPTVSCAIKNTPQNPYFIVRTQPLAPPVTFVTSTEHRQCP